MNRIVIDQTTWEQLQGLDQPVEVFDESGNLLGHFLPVSSQDPTASCPYSEEELVRMRRESGGRTLPEIWESLKEK